MTALSDSNDSGSADSGAADQEGDGLEDPSALLPLIYTELRRIAANYLRHERPDHTLQATALVHEAYVRLKGIRQVKWNDRDHFCAMAATIIRRILVNHALARRTRKRGGLRRRLELRDDMAVSRDSGLDLLSLDEALTKLKEKDPQKSRTVELRFFGGLTLKETAGVLGVSCRTAERNWRFARAFLQKEMTEGCSRDG